MKALYWSVRRELWENRSIYIAPLAAGVVYLCGFVISLSSLHNMHMEHPDIGPGMTYGHAAMMLILTALAVGVFYCLDALNGERRDRSILFWKSLPVSDVTTVLAKASIPLVILPLLVFVIVVVLQFVSLVLSAAGSAHAWAQVPLFELALSLLYGLLAMTLWYAPIYAWLLLMSAWARRPIVWAFLPPAAICIFEFLAFRTKYGVTLLQYRLVGWFMQAFEAAPPDNLDPHFIPLRQLAPGKLFTTPGLWVGLLFALAFLAAAARLRRFRGPI
jgi:ABC-2 type transport system permease protein